MELTAATQTLASSPLLQYIPTRTFASPHSSSYSPFPTSTGFPVDRCVQLATPDGFQFGVSLFIMVGIVISYAPQHYRIISRRSSEGISPYFVLLGTTSTTWALASVITLPTSREDMACCNEISDFACFAGILGVLQLTAQWACFTLILLLWLLFFPRASPLAPPQALKSTPAYGTALTITGICIVHALGTAIANIVVTSRFPEHLQEYASTLGTLATLLAVVQYLPQIWTTDQLKRVGSLSIPMMCIQVPGSYIWAASLAARLGLAGWSIWGLYMVTGILQGVILIMGIVYSLRERKERIAREEQEHIADFEEPQEEPADETTPLVRE